MEFLLSILHDPVRQKFAYIDVLMSDRNNKTECALLLQERQKGCGNSLARLCGLRGSYAWRSVR